MLYETLIVSVLMLAFVMISLEIVIELEYRLFVAKESLSLIETEIDLILSDNRECLQCLITELLHYLK